jgi:hypothetical protein
MQRLEQILRSSRIVAGGFLGRDARTLEEIVEDDARRLALLGLTAVDVARRMREIAEAAKKGLGTPVRVGDNLEASVSDTRGMMPCPWPHAGRYSKIVITVRRTDSGASLSWSDLGVHLIEAHGFFEGRGARFRLEPEDLAAMLF